MYDILKSLEANDKLGFYTVGNKKYHNKIQALIEVSGSDDFPKWDFNNSTFDYCTWDNEPKQNIRELYKQRAQQLRDNYDYIILNLSGGSDSTTVLYSFVNNGIFIDEVVVRHPEVGTKNLTITNNTNVAENAYNEWEYAAKPLLAWLKTASPHTKITIHDYSKDLLNPDYDLDWVFVGRDYLHPGIVKRYSYDIDSARNTYEKKSKVCMLFGIDKPRICIKDGAYWAYFLDIQANTAVNQIKEFDNITTEYFYWTPDLPDIPIKQSHMIVKWFEHSQNSALKTIIRWPNHDISQRTTYEMIVKSIIYPDYDFRTFQTMKPTSSFATEIDSWFYKQYNNTSAFQIWTQGLDFVKSQIDSKWFNKRLDQQDGFTGFISNFYKIKDLAQ